MPTHLILFDLIQHHHEFSSTGLTNVMDYQMLDLEIP